MTVPISEMTVPISKMTVPISGIGPCIFEIGPCIFEIGPCIFGIGPCIFGIDTVSDRAFLNSISAFKASGDVSIEDPHTSLLLAEFGCTQSRHSYH